MNIQDLTTLLLELMETHGKDTEIRIGDQAEAGPYFHDRVGGVWTSDTGPGYVILCAEDTDWVDELKIDEKPSDVELPVVWKPFPLDDNNDKAQEVNSRQ